MPRFVAEFVLPLAQLDADALYSTHAMTPASRTDGLIELLPCLICPKIPKTHISRSLANAYWQAQHPNAARDVEEGDTITISIAEATVGTLQLEWFGPIPLTVCFADEWADEIFDDAYLQLGRDVLDAYFRVREICPNHLDMFNWCVDLSVEPRCAQVGFVRQGEDGGEPVLA